MYENIADLKNFLISVGANQPFDIFNICSKIDNIEISSVPFKTVGLRGIAALAKDADDINCILVNSKLSYEEQNFHGIHELIHIYTGTPNSGQTFNCYDKVKPNQNSYVEWIANEGTAELLLPYKEVLPFIKDNISKFYTCFFPVYEICKVLAENNNVSQTVAENRLNSLKYEIFQYLNGVDLNNINILSKHQQELKGIKVDSLSQIEFKRFLDRISKHQYDISTPFFGYSESYRDSKLALSL